jgi:hypothetical protein
MKIDQSIEGHLPKWGNLVIVGKPGLFLSDVALTFLGNFFARHDEVKIVYACDTDTDANEELAKFKVWADAQELPPAKRKEIDKNILTLVNCYSLSGSVFASSIHNKTKTAKHLFVLRDSYREFHNCVEHWPSTLKHIREECKRCLTITTARCHPMGPPLIDTLKYDHLWTVKEQERAEKTNTMLVIERNHGGVDLPPIYISDVPHFGINLFQVSEAA